MRREEKHRRRLLQLQAEHPDTCFCKDAPRSLHDPILETWGESHYRKCSICGKKYSDAPAIAS